MDTDPYLSLVPEWEHDEGEDIARTPIFTLRRRRARSPRHPERPGSFVYLDSLDWVNVIAITPARRVVLIEQYRHGIGAVTLEIPGGMVEAVEDPVQAGARELEEETGYRGSGARLIGAVTPNPAILNNRCHTVLVTEAGPSGRPAPEEHEEIGVRLVPLDEIRDLVREGLIHHALVVAAFQHLWLREHS